MEENSTKTPADGAALFAGDVWFDPIEAGIRDRVRGFIEELIAQELEAALGRGRYERDGETPKGYRNGRASASCSARSVRWSSACRGRG
jgi:transposase-like protein